MNKPGRLIAVASGKGGVGKTFLSITLAHALARAGQRVLLFDADLGLANIDIQLGLVPHHDLARALADSGDILAAALPYARGGFSIIAGRSGLPSLASLAPVQLAHVANQLRAAATQYDIILTDLAAGIDTPARHLATVADRLLVVTTDEPTALTDAYAVLKLHQADLPPPSPADRRIVVNNAQSAAAGQRAYETLARACANFLGFTPRLAGIIRRDDRVREAIRHQTPLLTRSPAAVAALDIEKLARAFMEKDGKPSFSEEKEAKRLLLIRS